MTRIASRLAASEAMSAGQAERFAADLARLWPEGGRLGLAVSGGPDSLALLLLAQATIPGRFTVATVNHGLRPEAADECAMVESVCAERGIGCTILSVKAGTGNLQAAARAARYAALAEWAGREGLSAIATAHHADDQAETLLMRLNRASGLSGLAGVRARGVVPGARLSLLRPLLRWRQPELAEIVSQAGLEPAQDPSNADDAYDRVRIRKALADADWLDPPALAESAAHLADADEAIEWLVRNEWDERVSVAAGGAIRFEPGVPRAVALRMVARIVEGFGSPARGGAIARLVDGLEGGAGGNVAGVAASVKDGGWLFRPEAPRRP
jgi:tRNA(Ile)-lysidine synthase